MKKLLSLTLMLIFFGLNSQDLVKNITSNDSIVSTNDTIIQKELEVPYNPLTKPNTYNSTKNPNYWKNKMPYEGYWQQDVHYVIKAEIIDTLNMIKASQELIYTNNSPDDLNYVFFHLYANAFEPDSYLDKFRKGNKMKTIFREDEKKKKNLEINSISTEGESLDIEIDNTVMKVFLNEPLKSGETIKFNIDFESHFGGDENTGNVRRRMKTYTEFGNKHYNGVHWYPRISVYDSKFGWTTD